MFMFLFTVGFDEEATFTLSMRNQFKLIHNGYGYNKMSFSVVTGITTWRCASNQSYPHLKCRAKAYTKQIGMEHKLKLSKDRHTHAALQCHGNSRKKIKKIKKKSPSKKKSQPTTKN